MLTQARMRWFLAVVPATMVVAFALTASAAQDDAPALVKRLQAEKPTFAKRQQALLSARYDLADRPAPGATMSRGKPVQDGVRARLPAGTTWDQLAALSPEEVKARKLWPAAFLPLPHPHHEAGGMVFPRFLIAETRRQTGRDLTRYDLDFDLPDHLLPEFPSSSSMPPRTAAACRRIRESPVSIVMPTATRLPPPTRSATSGRTSIATGSTRRRCGA